MTRNRSNQIREQFAAGARLVGVKPLPLTSPVGPYTRSPGDILVEIVKGGVQRTQAEALEIARRRDAGARFRKQLARHYVFAVGGGE